MGEIVTTIISNAVVLGVMSMLALELRKDVRDTRDKVLILWEWHTKYTERRESPRGDSEENT